MLLICVDKAAESIDVFTRSEGFAVNILAQSQVGISGLFASKSPDKFNIADWTESESGYPILNGVCAWFDCRREQVIDAGDHAVILGRIQSYDYNQRNGLGYVRGGYLDLELEKSAVAAVESDADVIVGAIVEHDGKLLLMDHAKGDQLVVPASGLDGSAGSLNKLQIYLNELGIGITISSLFAVFEHEETGQQSIYYRAKADSDKVENGFWAFDHIPFERLDSSAIRTMIKRYISESARQRFGVYFGSDRGGAVKTLSE